MQADYVLDCDVIAASRGHHLFLAARIQAGPPPHSFQRRPLNPTQRGRCGDGWHDSA